MNFGSSVEAFQCQTEMYGRINKRRDKVMGSARWKQSLQPPDLFIRRSMRHSHFKMKTAWSESPWNIWLG